MRFDSNGAFVYDNEPEMVFNLLYAMGMGTTPNGVILDMDSNGAMIQVSGKTVKATTDINRIIYAGVDEVMFDPINNSKLLTSFFSRVLEKYKEENGLEAISYFSEDNIDNQGNKINRFGVRWADGSTIYTSYFYSRSLPIVEMIFILAEMNVNLHNFDVLEEKK